MEFHSQLNEVSVIPGGDYENEVIMVIPTTEEVEMHSNGVQNEDETMNS
jgi:hypothetical protein